MMNDDQNDDEIYFQQMMDILQTLDESEKKLRKRGM